MPVFVYACLSGKNNAFIFLPLVCFFSSGYISFVVGVQPIFIRSAYLFEHLLRFLLAQYFTGT